MHIDGATALVTGATSELGRELARQLHQRGARLVLTAPAGRALEGLAAGLEWAVALPGDPADPAQAAALARRAAEADIVVLVDGASGAGSAARRRAIGTGRIERGHAPEAGDLAALARLVAPALARRGRGRIAVVASYAGHGHRAAPPSHEETEHRVRRLATSLREELAGTAVGVSAVLPRPAVDVGPWPDIDRAREASAASLWAAARATIRAIEGGRDEVRPATPTLPTTRGLDDIPADLLDRLLGRRRESRPPSLARRGTRLC